MYQRGAFTGKLISLEIFYSKYLSFLFKGVRTIFFEKRDERWTGKAHFARLGFPTLIPPNIKNWELVHLLINFNRRF